jgi:hydroxymethylglutaryl-CoA lyase
MRAVVRAVGSRPVACHFHDTRGLGLANVTAALNAGVRGFDASLGGLGGCPFAPGATGNINTEDCVSSWNRSATIPASISRRS